jgi:hypothetical protein
VTEDTDGALQKGLAWSRIPQFICHQIGWWSCVLLMGWQGPLVMLAFVALHFYMTRGAWRGEALIAGVALVVGIAVDNGLHAAGAVQYVGELRVGASPVWLVAIWLGFGATLRHSQSVFVRSWRHACLVGVLGGPAAYYGGVKLARMAVDGAFGWLGISVAWTLAMAIVFLTVRWADANHHETADQMETAV